jgi:hypothetical protein
VRRLKKRVDTSSRSKEGKSEEKERRNKRGVIVGE